MVGVEGVAVVFLLTCLHQSNLIIAGGIQVLRGTAGIGYNESNKTAD